MTTYELTENIATLKSAIAADAEWIAEKGADPAVELKELEAKEMHRDELQKRVNMLQKELDAKKEAEKAALKPVDTDGKTDLTAQKAEFYRDAIAGRTVGKAYAGLGSIPANSADYGYGSKLLPTNMSRELVLEPYEDNSLREKARVTGIVNLREPKLGFTIGDDDLADVVDFETAKEIELEGDQITYGRHQTRIKAKVSSSTLNAADVDLVGTIENALRSGLALKEKINAFRTSSDTTHDHMSFYLTGITEVRGENIIDAIIQAGASLADKFQANAAVYMRRQDYYAAIREIAPDEPLWGRKPEDVIGMPVIFNDKAVVPVVGDFSYYGINYEGAEYDSDKDIDKGAYIFVLNAIGDQQIRLKSAFRLAYVRVMIIGASVGDASGDSGAAGDDIVVDAVTMNDGSTPVSGLTYLWEKYGAGSWTALTAAYTGYNTATLTTKSADANVSFRCKVTYTDDDGKSTVYTPAKTMAAAG